MKRYAIGDIHGELELLRRALAWIDKDRGSDEDYEVVFVGDYIDRGPDSAGVIELLMQREREDREERLISDVIRESDETGVSIDIIMRRGRWEHELEADGKTCFRVSRPRGKEWKAMSEALRETKAMGLEAEAASLYIHDTQGWIFEWGALWRPKRRWVFLAGNHEDMMMRAVEEASDNSGRTTCMEHWGSNGGTEAIASWKEWSRQRGLPERVPDHHVKWIATLPLSHRSGRLFFVHADADPSKPVERQERNFMLWNRDQLGVWEKRYVLRQPLLCEDGTPVMLVHGHTPTRRLPKYLPGIKLNVDTGAVFGGYLTVAAWDDDAAHPRVYRVNKYNADTKTWNDSIKSWE